MQFSIVSSDVNAIHREENTENVTTTTKKPTIIITKKKNTVISNCYTYPFPGVLSVVPPSPKLSDSVWEWLRELSTPVFFHQEEIFNVCAFSLYNQF